jgi:2-oxoglutarate ferredoxin oxidoreductase subunit beta
MNPLALALGAGASFVARAVDKDPNHLGEIIKKAYEHQGCAFVEIYQDCNIFNNGAFDEFALKANRSQNTVLLQEGQPLRFGAEQESALTLNNEHIERVAFSEAEKYHHDSTDFISAMRLARLTFPDYPVPLGVYYQQTRDKFEKQTEFKKTTADLPALFRAKASWQQG